MFYKHIRVWMVAALLLFKYKPNFSTRGQFVSMWWMENGLLELKSVLSQDDRKRPKMAAQLCRENYF